jgi:uncharacterized protein YndB with AHSA1/START domain
MRVLALLLLLAGSPAAAEVVKSGEHGLELHYSHIVPGPPNEAMEAFANVDQWWDPDHSYSGNSENLSLKLEAGGCFCERLPNGGGVEHLRVVHVDPGKRIILTGSLGPLLYEATTGVMDVQFKPAGNGTRVLVDYRVAGFANGGAAKMAPLVDQVLDTIVTRFAVYATPPAPLAK